ncbi:acyl--CoA ligase [Mesorhizobium sp. CO1-1-8]|uniref:acyl--CoA ligase n=1 Tax=Mesorhizobium sp. CO1-1-8 TaxID=2876631 RepID=UPI001CD13037|nr:acyl--CoA ligase [Mesorhizobium sp. CO1-1-8]MBZ9772312.1 acyl--CoA ligase [Mesorhizobium sp. CO1-1-8]
MPDTIWNLLSSGADDANAIGAPEASLLTFSALRELVRNRGAELNRRGIGRNSRVAIVLPNGPEMATAFLTVAAVSTAAPLNPSYRLQEFEFYIADLGASLLICQENNATPAREAAAKLGVPILEIKPDGSGVPGQFTFIGLDNGDNAAPIFAEADDVALVLHTSGTTSKPKIVPLSQRNVTKSAGNIASTLELASNDRCLNIMPLFHIHGLIAALLAPLSVGGSVWCSSGFNALKFFSWMNEAAPTWYTAVPTMHQAILARSASNRAIIERHPLRFIRSSSSALPPQVTVELEAVFGCPVLEAYGMTEAAHQMASNQLGDVARKPGSVGRAAGPEVAIMGDDGNLLGTGQLGEIVIRGPNVTAGYENNPTANAAAFCNGWFRTGDQGTLDEDGDLRIDGRLKEIINRGGEKISPREVDEALMDHPDVAQAVTYAVAHDKLGEDVAAAIVLREGAKVTDRELRDFAANRLAPFKVPRKIVFLAEIPKGPTGKLQRIGLEKVISELSPDRCS